MSFSREEMQLRINRFLSRAAEDYTDNLSCFKEGIEIVLYLNSLKSEEWQQLHFIGGVLNHLQAEMPKHKGLQQARQRDIMECLALYNAGEHDEGFARGIIFAIQPALLGPYLVETSNAAIRTFCEMGDAHKRYALTLIDLRTGCAKQGDPRRDDVARSLLIAHFGLSVTTIEFSAE